MKRLIIIALMLTQIIVMAQTPAKDKGKAAEEATILSLAKQEVSPEDLRKKYVRSYPSMTFGPEKVEQTLVLSNGDTVRFSTTDDKKVRRLLANLTSISAVDFLLELRNIQGSITFPYRNSSWVRREDIPSLLKLAKIDIVTPAFKQHIPSNDKILGVVKRYEQTPMAINALRLIYSYFSSRFPVAEVLTPTYESVQTWYESGKPKEDYKLVLFKSLVKDEIPFSKFKKRDN